MTYQFENPIACTEALVTAIEELNDFGQYTLTILGIDQNGCYTNKKLAQMAIACVIRCRSTHGKQLRVRDIIEMNRPGLYQQLSRGDKCRVGRAVSKLYNQGMLPHLTRGKKKGSTNTYFC